MSGGSRRQFLIRAGRLMAAGAFVEPAGTFAGPRTLAAAGRRPAGSGAHVFFVGSLTTRERGGRGEGITVFREDEAGGAWTRVQTVSGEVNPSFLALDRSRAVLFVSHSDAGQVSAFSVDRASGRLALLNRQPTGGRNPAHVVVDPSGRWVLVANYGGGSVAAFPVSPEGALGDRAALVELTGPLGPHRTEQAASHPHQCRFDPSGRVLAVPDKGLDRVFLFALDPSTGTLTPAEPASVTARPGAGPRHLHFHPAAPFAYVANELDSTISSWRVDASGAWLPLQIVPTTPPTFTAVNTPAAISVTRDGRFVYVSNRGHDSIAAFTVDPKTGLLGDASWTPSGGRVPRFACLDDEGERLYVANQATDAIQAFRIDEGTGALTPEGSPLAVGTPTALAWLALGDDRSRAQR